MRTEDYFTGYKAGHRDGFQRLPALLIGQANAEIADGYARGYIAGAASRDYAEAHGKPTTNFRNPAHRARVLEGR